MTTNAFIIESFLFYKLETHTGKIKFSSFVSGMYIFIDEHKLDRIQN